MSSCLAFANRQEEIARPSRTRTSNLEKTRSLGSLRSDRKESGQGDRESNVRLNDQDPRGKRGRKNQSNTTTVRRSIQISLCSWNKVPSVTFARRDDIVTGFSDVGEGEVDHGSRVSAARQRSLPQTSHRTVRRVAVAVSRFSSCLFSLRRVNGR